MKLIKVYRQLVDKGTISEDPIQISTLEALQGVLDALQSQRQRWWHRWIKAKPKPLRGLYLWGGVGIGKTFLMDIFFEHLPIERKLRMHFHRFMQEVHHELKRVQGHPNPLSLIARHFSMQARVICFDEFFVHDITDAMLLGNLFEALFKKGVCLIATSNVAPDRLYWKGLQRKRFLPTIALIKEHTTVIHLTSSKDYRLKALTQKGTYFSPLNEDSQQQMRRLFDLFSHGSEAEKMPLVIAQRPIATIKLANKVVWFSFHTLCNIPRSQMDYLEIAKRYPVVLVSDVPQIKANQDAQITYLINLVDVLYDHHVQLILSCEVDIEAIYLQGSRQFEFERTKSRLIEMQSHDYIVRTSSNIDPSNV